MWLFYARGAKLGSRSAATQGTVFPAETTASRGPPLPTFDRSQTTSDLRDVAALAASTSAVTRTPGNASQLVGSIVAPLPGGGVAVAPAGTTVEAIESHGGLFSSKDAECGLSAGIQPLVPSCWVTLFGVMLYP